MIWLQQVSVAYVPQYIDIHAQDIDETLLSWINFTFICHDKKFIILY